MSGASPNLRFEKEGTPIEIIGWIIFGFIAGGIASLLVPGRTPLGCIGVILVGIAGGLLGGFLFEALFDIVAVSFLGALIIAIIGAVIILLILRALAGPR
jgi:uncharacterized membrane protein YeaQ/YmgE (transglycosylase-associated protein family)